MVLAQELGVAEWLITSESLPCVSLSLWGRTNYVQTCSFDPDSLNYILKSLPLPQDWAKHNYS